MKEVIWKSVKTPPLDEGKYLVVCKRADEAVIQVRSLRPTTKKGKLTWSANTHWPALTIALWTELPTMPDC